MPTPKRFALKSLLSTSRHVLGWCSTAAVATVAVATAACKDESLLYMREWAGRGSALSGSRPLRVVQFNILADGLSAMDAKKGGFSESPVDSLEWTYRREKVLEEVFRHFEPDLVAFQEVDHYDWLAAEMSKRGLSGTFKAKANSPCRRSLDPTLEDGCALFWRDATIERKAVHTLNYAALDFDGAPHPTLQQSNQVAIIAEMTRRGEQDSSPFVLAVSHLAAQKDVEGERIRKQQITQLVRRTREVAEAASVRTTIVCLDMNAAPHESASAKYPPEAYPAALSLGMRSAYAEALGSEPPYSTYKKRGSSVAKHVIDYILISPDVRVGRVLLPPAEEGLEPSALPGWRYPSDHVALMAELDW